MRCLVPKYSTASCSTSLMAFTGFSCLTLALDPAWVGFHFPKNSRHSPYMGRDGRWAWWRGVAVVVGNGEGR